MGIRWVAAEQQSLFEIAGISVTHSTRVLFDELQPYLRLRVKNLSWQPVLLTPNDMLCERESFQIPEVDPENWTGG